MSIHEILAVLTEQHAAIAAGDATALRHSSHKLAGGALNLGVGYAGEAVRRIEAIADTGTTEGAAELLDEVEDALARGREAFAHSLDQLLGAAWDDALEPFRRAGDGAPVTWLHRVG